MDDYITCFLCPSAAQAQNADKENVEEDKENKFVELLKEAETKRLLMITA